MKILAIGDIHGDVELARSMAQKADNENVDLVILCGDITQSENSIENLVGAFNKKVLLIPGNHESMATANFLAELYNAKNLHGYSVKKDGIGFFGCGSANIGLFQLPEDEITDVLKKGHKYLEDCKTKIMVTHVHPTETNIEKMSCFFPGSTGVKKAVDELQPDILLCSHVHEAEGMEENLGKTKVISVGRKGRILEL